jgi:hypothetical protein
MKIAQRRSLKSHLQAKYRFGSGRAFLLDCGFNANGPCIIPVRPGALHIRVSWAFYWPLTSVDQNKIHDFRSCLNLSWLLLGTPS